MNLMQSLSLDNLVAHPANTNRMSKVNFARLAAHIKRTGRYEPIVVRPHPTKTGCYQILNGHHRVKVLRQLGYREADCVCWQVDDAEADVLLATVNRLCGRDDVQKKSELIKRLSRRFSIKEMAKMLPDGKKQLERLQNLQKPMAISSTQCFANAVVFFLTDEQKAILDKALNLARQIRERREERKKGLGSAKQRACGLVTIAESFIVNHRANHDIQDSG